MLLYKPASFERLVELFTAKYGQPGRRVSRPYHTVGGASDENQEVAWYFSDGPFAAVRYGSAMDGGFAEIHAPDLDHELARRQAEKTKADAMRDLGPPTRP